MPESRRVPARPQSGDVLDAVYVEMLRDLSEAAQTSVVSPNVTMYRGAQGGTAFAVDDVAPPTSNGWLGVIRESGPNGEENFPASDPRYWVERVVANEEGTFNVISIVDKDEDAAPGSNYVAAVNIAECQYLDGGGESTFTGVSGVLTGRFVRVFSLPGAGTFNYFDAGDGIIRVRLDHQGDGVYNAYAWSDPDFENEPLGTAVQPEYRPFGTSIDFTQYAETGFGYIDDDSNFVLILAIEERYDVNPCPDP